MELCDDHKVLSQGSWEVLVMLYHVDIIKAWVLSCQKLCCYIFLHVFGLYGKHQDNTISCHFNTSIECADGVVLGETLH